MMKFPKITIITPSYNQGQYIEQTILSIINQNYPNLEYIIIDGGSNDNTVKIIKKYKKHVAYWVSEPDRGQAHAINKGLTVATGEIFNWINSDDFLEPGALFEIANQFQKNPKALLLCGYCRVFHDKTNKTSHIYRMGVHKNISDNFFNPIMCQPSSFYKIVVIKQLGYLNESLNYVFDDELWFRFLSFFGINNIIYSEKQFTQFRLHTNSKSIGDGFQKFYFELQNIWYEIGKQIKIKNILLNSLKNELKNWNYITNSWNIINIDKNNYEAELCKRYVYTYYKNFKYVEAKFCLKTIIRYKIKYISFKLILLIIKLYVLPPSILKFLRK